MKIPLSSLLLDISFEETPNYLHLSQDNCPYMSLAVIFTKAKYFFTNPITIRNVHVYILTLLKLKINLLDFIVYEGFPKTLWQVIF